MWLFPIRRLCFSSIGVRNFSSWRTPPGGLQARDFGRDNGRVKQRSISATPLTKKRAFAHNPHLRFRVKARFHLCLDHEEAARGTAKWPGKGRKPLRRPRRPQTALRKSRAPFRSTGGRARRQPQQRRPAGRQDEADISWGVLLSGAAEVGLPKMVFCAAGRRNAERAFAVKPIIARFSQGGNNTADWICDVLQNFGRAVKCAANFPETTKQRKNRGTSHLVCTKGLLYSALVQN